MNEKISVQSFNIIKMMDKKLLYESRCRCGVLYLGPY